MDQVPPPLAPLAPRPLERLPFPPFAKALALVTLVAFVAGVARLPRAVGLGLDAERGKKELAAGQDAAAARRFARVIAAFPQAKQVRMDLIEASLHTEMLGSAAEGLQWFDGKEVSKEEEARLDALGADFEARAKADEAANPERRAR